NFGHDDKFSLRTEFDSLFCHCVFPLLLFLFLLRALRSFPELPEMSVGGVCSAPSVYSFNPLRRRGNSIADQLKVCKPAQPRIRHSRNEVWCRAVVLYAPCSFRNPVTDFMVLIVDSSHAVGESSV